RMRGSGHRAARDVEFAAPHPVFGSGAENDTRNRKNAGWRAEGNQGQRISGGSGAFDGARADQERSSGPRRKERRAGSRSQRCRLPRGRGRNRARRRSGLCAQRPDREGQGAARAGAQEAQIRASALHLFASGGRPETDRRPHGLRRHRHRLRDGDVTPGHASAADADVGGRGSHGAACRRALPGKGKRRPRGAARRRSQRSAGGRLDPRRRGVRQRGGAVAGSHAALISAGMGATVTVIDRNPDVLRRIANQLGARVRTVFSTSDAIETLCRRADLVIASVLIPGAAAPKLITVDTVKAMKAGSVIVDIAIDQGGCSETSRPTTHLAPTYIVYDVVHYCVTNMPGAVARTSTFALNNVTLPFVLALADKGYRRALGEDEHLRHGLNVYEGAITHRAVAEALKLKFTPPEAALRL